MLLLMAFRSSSEADHATLRAFEFPALQLGGGIEKSISPRFGGRLRVLRRLYLPISSLLLFKGCDEFRSDDVTAEGFGVTVGDPEEGRPRLGLVAMVASSRR